MAFAAAIFAAFLGLIMFCWFATRKPTERIAQQRSSHTIAVTLMPGSMRSEGVVTQRVKVPPKGTDVKLELQLTNTSFHTYKSQLFRENESLQTTDALKMEAKGDQQIVPINAEQAARLLANLMPPGQPGLDRIKAIFTINDRRQLRVNVIDLKTNKLLIQDAVLATLR